MTNGEIKEGTNILRGYSSPSSVVDGGAVDLNTLAFKIMIPEKYLVQLAASRPYHTLNMRRQEEETEKRGNDIAAMGSAFAAEQQRQIDSNSLTLNINGLNVGIEQGDLRKIMSERLDELKDKKDHLEQSGAHPSAIMAVSSLIEDYEVLIPELRDAKADEKTVEALQNLIEKDPELATQIMEHSKNSADTEYSSEQTRTSFAAEHFDEGGISAPSLKAVFQRESAPDGHSKPSVDTSSQSPDRALENTFDSFGI